MVNGVSIVLSGHWLTTYLYENYTKLILSWTCRIKDTEWIEMIQKSDLEKHNSQYLKSIPCECRDRKLSINRKFELYDLLRDRVYRKSLQVYVHVCAYVPIHKPGLTYDMHYVQFELDCWVWYLPSQPARSIMYVCMFIYCNVAITKSYFYKYKENKEHKENIITMKRG